MTDADHVVLLDADARPIGTALKSTVHDADTALHLAFSCHVRDASGRVLITRRALGKKTWPGVWTNSFCGHPRPGEDLIDAVRRHARAELGMTLGDIRSALPDFRYRAVDADGIVENEVCPVFLADTADAPTPDPREVMEAVWADPSDISAALQGAPWAFSPWFVLQAEQMSLFSSAPDLARSR